LAIFGFGHYWLSHKAPMAHAQGELPVISDFDMLLERDPSFDANRVRGHDPIVDADLTSVKVVVSENALDAGLG
jgi:hypothetical protein